MAASGGTEPPAPVLHNRNGINRHELSRYIQIHQPWRTERPPPRDSAPDGICPQIGVLDYNITQIHGEDSRTRQGEPGFNSPLIKRLIDLSAIRVPGGTFLGDRIVSATEEMLSTMNLL